MFFLPVKRKIAFSPSLLSFDFWYKSPYQDECSGFLMKCYSGKHKYSYFLYVKFILVLHTPPSKTLICKWEKQGKQKITYSNSIFKRHMRYKKKNEFVMESICFCEIPNDLGGFIPPLTPQFNIAQYNQNWQFCSEKIALICRLNFWGLMNVHPFQIFNGFLNLRNERVY